MEQPEGIEPCSAQLGRLATHLMLGCLVGSLGVEPSIPEEADLQSAAVASAAHYPWREG